MAPRLTLWQQLKLLAEREPRNSRAICAQGEALLQAGQLPSLKDEQWTFLEMLFYAAADLGKADLASVCADRLAAKFPDSPRVRPLAGVLLEIQGKHELARALYEKELELDAINVPIRKRLIALHLHGPVQSTSQLSVKKGIELLVEYVDTVYADAEAWEELAAAYAELGLYQQSLSAVGDLILLQPQNPFYTLQYAETAYTLNDLELAYNYYLKTLELSGFSLKGVGRRAAFGIKLCASKLSEGLPGSKAPSPHSPSGTPSPQRMYEVDALVSEKLLEASSKEWSQPGDRVPSQADTRALRGWITSLVRA